MISDKHYYNNSFIANFQNDTRKQKFLETDIDGSPTPSYRERMVSFVIWEETQIYEK